MEVAGCGVCHTDLSFLHHGVKTRGALPLVLGHEISGIVREVGSGVDADARRSRRSSCRRCSPAGSATSAAPAGARSAGAR